MSSKRVRSAKQVLLLIPIYDDWDAVARLLDQIGQLALPKDVLMRALVIDDGSTRPMPNGFLKKKAGSRLGALSVITLARNLGHQGAIAVGLGHIDKVAGAYDAVIVMDGDGEDAPQDILGLLSAWKGTGHKSAVFAQRSQRSEGLLFRVFYRLYQAAYRVLTGTSIAMGNFSLLPRDYVAKLILYPELWRHFPATVKKSKLPVILLPTRRASRTDGSSKMNFYYLILHGLGAITVHSDIVGVRSLVAVCALLLACFGALGGLAFAVLAHGSVVPIWTSTLLVSLTMIALQFLSSAILFSFLTLAGRSAIALNPALNTRSFVKQVHRGH